MGVGTNNNSSQGFNSYSANPLNLQNWPYQAMSSPVAAGIQNATGMNSTGMVTQNGNILSPYYSNYGNFNNVNSNPLVAGMTGQQGYLVNQAGANADTNNWLNQQAYGNIANASNFANSNPLQFANAANAGSYNSGSALVNNMTPWAEAAGNAGGAIVNNMAPWASAAGAATGSIVPNMQPWAQAAGDTAGSIVGNMAPWATASGNTAGNIFGNMAPWQNAAGGVAGGAFNPAYGAAGNMLSPNYAARLATSPQTRSAIQSAVNPMIQAFNAQTVPGLQGMFTAAGQRTNSASGVGGSSAFDIAGANAMTGLESQIGQTAGGIANQAYQTGLGQQSQAISQIGNLAGQQAGIYNTGAQNVTNAMAQQAAGQNAVANAIANATGMQSQDVNAVAANIANATAMQGQGLNAIGQNIANASAQQAGALNTTSQNVANATAQQAAAQNTAAQTGGALASEQLQNLLATATGSQGVSTSTLNNTINALNASALPQLTQQYGINQGLQLYQTQVNQLMTALGLGAQASQPAIAYNTQGGGSTSGSGKGFNAGIPIVSSRRYKEDIVPLGDAADRVVQLRPVSFRYRGSPTMRYGFIAEEVAEVLPEAVVHGPGGRIEGIDLAHFPALCVAALQRQHATIAALEARLAALENR